jgi:hypothetical protein
MGANSASSGPPTRLTPCGDARRFPQPAISATPRHGEAYRLPAVGQGRGSPVFGEKHWKEPFRWNAAAQRAANARGCSAGRCAT